ncbi:AAA family ATPase [Pseudoalteromonas luteoviolacea]|uniref:Deoxynucleoside kinase domain-containing protein n=1 Tax=Pseudoalteromonas luteoviolacea S4054 TaxID=1129367 RepID=A0A0F6A8F3_9GAMM|nr:AAA family ATPase [Pseudoalteromonas luteoviolacea]AOT08670.1 hypothetical protein S4054249_12755 [Pseudoalteromonas luteoviolacea]AOT13585.1 hypothetical protein S40542_12730 [Pseudoalteromonas luteoviolacea]AOT18498.1 hypothetical protein S4054_12730 [Pseudoalteromonas luteoviolacea]KKE82497.1 hypothetical protein N479_17985 [Pseudoalteromonas luteoviolacea S4054]KZN72034.1 hypothetical protein N481_16620 [Pseudoalteromonas luteoviolacea S4047-1]
MSKKNFVITLEGVPAVGKSTVASILEQEHGYCRIPEVNELFPERPSPEPAHWYALKQLERSHIATQNEYSLLDGDIFQVIWLSWIYPDRGFIEHQKAADLFIDNAESLRLPSLFVYLYIDEDIRYQRELEREMKRGHDYQQFIKKYQRYKSMNVPQQALFEAIDKQYPGWVLFLDNNDSHACAKKIAQRCHTARMPSPKEFVVWLRGWLLQHNPITR